MNIYSTRIFSVDSDEQSSIPALNQWVFDAYSATLIKANMSLTFRPYITKKRAVFVIQQMSVSPSTRLYIAIEGDDAIP